MIHQDDIEIEFRAVKKIVIFESLRLSKEELLKRIRLFMRTGQPITLHWAEGQIFLVVPFHATCKSVIDEAMKGIIYWQTVVFASMSKYEPFQKIGGIEVPIINQTPSHIMRKVAQKLKELK
jgi:hypothetical protein